LLGFVGEMAGEGDLQMNPRDRDRFFGARGGGCRRQRSRLLRLARRQQPPPARAGGEHERHQRHDRPQPARQQRG